MLDACGANAEPLYSVQGSPVLGENKTAEAPVLAADIDTFVSNLLPACYWGSLSTAARCNLTFVAFNITKKMSSNKLLLPDITPVHLVLVKLTNFG